MSINILPGESSVIGPVCEQGLRIAYINVTAGGDTLHHIMSGFTLGEGEQLSIPCFLDPTPMIENRNDHEITVSYNLHNNRMANMILVGTSVGVGTCIMSIMAIVYIIFAFVVVRRRYCSRV